MSAPIRPPPLLVLIIHDGQPVDTYMSFLQSAGLRAEETQPGTAAALAVALKPDIIVLDFDCDGEIMAALQADFRTREIPVIALAELPHRFASDDESET